MEQFYVYEWYNVKTGEVFYVGKGSKKRYLDKTHRNKLFLDYVEHNEVLSRIIKYFNNEEEAFQYEKELTQYYRDKGQCQCCLIDGGFGGYSKVWNDQLRDYWSRYNPMKQETQRERMRNNNPMKNAEIAKKTGIKHMIPVIVNGVEYRGLTEASQTLGVDVTTIANWCKKGQSTSGGVCSYIGERHTKTHPCIVDNIYYSSVAEASRKLNLPYSSLLYSLKKQTNCQGHICSYANQQPSQQKPIKQLEGSTTNE